MGLFYFYNVRKPKQFNYRPIYYDPRKEAMEERKLKVKRELGMEISDKEYKPQVRGSFVDATTHLRKSHLKGDDTHSRMYKNVRLALILTLLLVLLLWFLLG
ncbi:MAG: hypothetical protein LBQ73_02780 [Tannerellaceae bacterium]|jgi:hypothetical protein|nr:hypothetical protein [Tannerellaceae bacterium]